MSNARIQPTTFNDYEYLNENSIDGELKCALCMLPFQSPVSGECGHTFCADCLNPWLARQSTCPTCRLPIASGSFHPISTRIVLNQLDRLLLRCRRCNQSNIQRSDLNEHEKRCPKQTVSCPAFDIKCPWKGTRSELTKHLEECSFQKIRPAITDLYEHLKNVYEPLVEDLQTAREQFQMQVMHIHQQNRFLLAVFNRGKPMTERCPDQQRRCQFQHANQNYHRNPRNQPGRELLERIPNQQAMQNPWMMDGARPFGLRGHPTENQWGRDSPMGDLFNCTNCQNGLQANDVVLHHCDGGVICRQCLENYGNLDAPPKGTA